MKIILQIFILLSLSGCVTYKAVGKFDNNSDVFIGNVSHNLMGGGGKYEFTNVNSEITCTGIASRPDKVPFNLIGCEGQSGLANGVCSDGKRLNMRWYASTCTTGYGFGSSNDGSKFRFTFGLTKENAMSSLDIMLEEIDKSNISLSKESQKDAIEECKKKGIQEKTEEFSRCVLEY